MALVLPPEFIDEMVAHAREDAPNECCGIIAGSDGTAQKLFRAKNAEADAERLRDVVEDVLMATRSAAEPLTLNSEPLLLERMVSQAVEHERSRQPQVDFAIRATSPDAAVLGDEACLGHVLRDLVRTAAGRAPSGSTLDVSVGAGQLSIIEQRQDSAAGSAVHGDADDSDGWRMQVCRELIDAMGGRLRLNDGPSRQIMLELPVAAGD